MRFRRIQSVFVAMVALAGWGVMSPALATAEVERIGLGERFSFLMCF